MSQGRITEFFRNRANRNHADTAELLGVSEDWLHNWVRRYSAEAAPRIAKQRAAAKERGTYQKRAYDNGVLAVFLFACGFHDFNIETHHAISLGLRTFRQLEKDVVDPLIEAEASEDELRTRLTNTLAVVHKIAGHSHHIHVVDRRNLADVLPLYFSGHVITSACGVALLSLIDRVADQVERSAPPKRKVA
jgi:hypothetical protein